MRARVQLFRSARKLHRQILLLTGVEKERFQRDIFGFVMLARRCSMELKRVALECERRAAEFRSLAESGSRPNRRVFLELEQHWLHLACVYYQANVALQALSYLGTGEELERLNSSDHSIH